MRSGLLILKDRRVLNRAFKDNPTFRHQSSRVLKFDPRYIDTNTYDMLYNMYRHIGHRLRK